MAAHHIADIAEWTTAHIGGISENIAGVVEALEQAHTIASTVQNLGIPEEVTAITGMQIPNFASISNIINGLG
jgi:hypothetical protein